MQPRAQSRRKYRALLPFLSFLVADALAAPLQPDLVCEIHNVSQTTVSGQPAVRFGTWAVNLGSGPLDLRLVDLGNGTRDVYQRVFATDGSYTDTFLGNFPIDPNTQYVRMPDAADYFLREVNEDDSLGAVLKSNEKVGYCFVDSQQHSNSPPGTPSARVYGGSGPGTYPACSSILGVSVGWVDVYGPGLPNQWVYLTGLSSGTYWLENTLDPLNRLSESQEGNNVARTKVTISTGLAPEISLLGNGVSIPDGDTTPGAADARTLATPISRTAASRAPLLSRIQATVLSASPECRG